MTRWKIVAAVLAGLAIPDDDLIAQPAEQAIPRYQERLSSSGPKVFVAGLYDQWEWSYPAGTVFRLVGFYGQVEIWPPDEIPMTRTGPGLRRFAKRDSLWNAQVLLVSNRPCAMIVLENEVVLSSAMKLRVSVAHAPAALIIITPPDDTARYHGLRSGPSVFDLLRPTGLVRRVINSSGALPEQNCSKVHETVENQSTREAPRVADNERDQSSPRIPGGDPRYRRQRPSASETIQPSAPAAPRRSADVRTFIGELDQTCNELFRQVYVQNFGSTGATAEVERWEKIGIERPTTRIDTHTLSPGQKKLIGCTGGVYASGQAQWSFRVIRATLRD